MFEQYWIFQPPASQALAAPRANASRCSPRVPWFPFGPTAISDKRRFRASNWRSTMRAV